MRDLIDFDFCRERHGFESDAEVLAWFQQPSLPDFRTFAARFSPIDYVLQNEDVRKGGVNPIQHYLSHGASERRPIVPAPMLRAYLPGQPPAELSGEPTVAFVVHLFYDSYVDHFLDRLANIDLAQFDVFISTTAEIMEAHGARIADQLGDHLKEIYPIENRGRNFQPLFVRFGDRLGDYDAICHVHSKESRYSGRRQTEWADYLIAATLGVGKVTRRHVDMIASGQCDVIAPAPFRILPPWACHSLSNRHHLGEMCRKLGIEPAEGFMTYPVGGMFWMGRRIVRAIATLGLTSEDFPPEPSQPDGEVHHALERLIGVVAGKRLAFFDQVTGSYWDPSTVLLAELQRFTPLESLIEAIKSKDVVTFDFFDTLCLRSTGDEEWAKKRVETILGGDYRQRRNAAESELRGRLGGAEDVSLTQIATKLLDDGYDDAVRATGLERIFDLKTLRPNAKVAKGYVQAIKWDKYVMILSDSYYDEGFIREFLEQNDLPQPDRILVSGACGMRKDRGDMWHYMAGVRQARPALHVGDNIHSDIQLAAARGFDTFYVPHWRHMLQSCSGISSAVIHENLLNGSFGASVDHLEEEGEEPEAEEEKADAN